MTTGMTVFFNAELQLFTVLKVAKLDGKVALFHHSRMSALGRFPTKLK
jgi:hypothetical protein